MWWNDFISFRHHMVSDFTEFLIIAYFPRIFILLSSFKIGCFITILIFKNNQNIHKYFRSKNFLESSKQTTERVYILKLCSSLLQISEFVLDKKFQWNASKFTIFHMYENPKLLFTFFILCYLEKYQVERNKKRKKQLWVFVYIKHGKFWSVSLDN